MVVDEKEELVFNVYTLKQMESTAIKRTVHKKIFRIHSQYDYLYLIISFYFYLIHQI